MLTETWQVFDRYRKERIAEPIYGEQWLRWAYEKRLGEFTTWAFASRTLFSRLYGWKMRRRSSAKLIAPFVRDYGVDAAEAELPLDQYESFNHFFTRRLKTGVRPIASDPDAVVFPADGRHFLLSNLAGEPWLWAKGERFSVETLLGPLAFAVGPEVLQGDAVVSRLAPVDYHRFHFPWQGKVLAQATLSGPLYSVHPLAIRKAIRYLVSNKRTVSILEDERIGRWVMVEIGATNVGTICQTHPGQAVAERGAEKGFFAFGGSCVVTIWPRGRMRFSRDLEEVSRDGVELYARMGDSMAAVQLARK